MTIESDRTTSVPPLADSRFDASDWRATCSPSLCCGASEDHGHADWSSRVGRSTFSTAVNGIAATNSIASGTAHWDTRLSRYDRTSSGVMLAPGSTAWRPRYDRSARWNVLAVFVQRLIGTQSQGAVDAVGVVLDVSGRVIGHRRRVSPLLIPSGRVKLRAELIAFL